MNIVTRFVIIDDDEINNKICTLTIKKMAKDAYIRTFSDPYVGFEHVVTEYADPDQDFKAILFLDINMPGMDGWEFLERFDRLSPAIKNRITICLLSSSNDNRDMKRANENKNVMYYIIKPLTGESVRLITYSLNRGKKPFDNQ